MKNKELVLKWLTRMPFAITRNLTVATGLPGQTINRLLNEARAQGRVESRMAGRGSRAVRHWFLTSDDLESRYSVDHRHGQEATHFHDPLRPEIAPHRHAPWHLTEAGLRVWYKRLEELSSYYDVAFRLFKEAGPEWLKFVGAEPVLTDFTLLRRGGLAGATGEYRSGNDKFTAVFCHMGRQLKTFRMLEKWEGLFSPLTGTSRAEEINRSSGDPLDPPQPPDPDFDPAPQPSVYVVIGADEFAVRQAMDHIPQWSYLQTNSFSWWVAGNPCRRLGESGYVLPLGDTVADHFEDVNVGEPEMVAPPVGAHRDDPPYPALLSNTLPYRIMCLAEEWPALREEDCVDLLDEFRGPVDRAFSELRDAGLLQRVEDVYYISDEYMLLIAARDRVSVGTVRNRLLTYLDEKMVRHLHDLEHNRGLLRIARVFHRHGIRVYGGWRRVVDVLGANRKRITQIQPDAVIYADGPFGRGVYLIEFERNATTPGEIREKVKTYRLALRHGIDLRVIWITETKRAARRFLQRRGTPPTLATTLDELEAGPLIGPKTIWRSRDDANPQLLPM